MTTTCKPAQAPWSAEAEQAVLGAILMDNLIVHRLADTGLNCDHFYNDAHSRIWSAAMALIGAGKPADVLTVYSALGADLAVAGGMAYLNDLVMSVPSARNAWQYAHIVVEHAKRRRLISAGTEIQALMAGEDASSIILDKAQTLLSTLQQADSRSKPVALLEAVTCRLDRWEAMGAGQLAPGLATHFECLDRHLGGGLQKGRVVVLAARPSVGKTSFGVQIALNVAADSNRVLILSQEMPRGDLVDRITANLGRVRLDVLGLGIAPNDADTWSRVVDATERARQMKLEIDDQPALSLLAIRSKAVLVKSQRGLDVLLLDYLQLCSASDRKLSRHHQIEEISRGLKSLAKELDICIVVLSQINRDVAKSDREATLADLKESGAIEEDADVVLLLHPCRELPDRSQLVACTIAKNRQGSKGKVALRFTGEYQRWQECDLDITAREDKRANPRRHDNGL